MMQRHSCLWVQSHKGCEVAPHVVRTIIRRSGCVVAFWKLTYVSTSSPLCLVAFGVRLSECLPPRNLDSNAILLFHSGRDLRAAAATFFVQHAVERCSRVYATVSCCTILAPAPPRRNLRTTPAALRVRVCVRSAQNSYC